MDTADPQDRQFVRGGRLTQNGRIFMLLVNITGILRQSGNFGEEETTEMAPQSYSFRDTGQKRNQSGAE